MTPDASQVKARLKVKLARMLSDYSKHGTYTDADGKSYTDNTAILNTWKEIDALEGKGTACLT